SKRIINNFIKMRDFETIKSEAIEHYSSLKEVYCPYFRENIHFNSKGINHILRKSWNKVRGEKDQLMRFKNIKLAPVIISKSHTIQDILHTKRFERIRRNNRWDTILTNVSYYEFIAMIDNIRLKIIVKEIDFKDKFFWSIIPFWGKKISEEND
ncbi:MAG: hypothetical protein Q7R78_02535, partial [bacterium]|nr:hypothetical protein [bacterium]